MHDLRRAASAEDRPLTSVQAMRLRGAESWRVATRTRSLLRSVPCATSAHSSTRCEASFHEQPRASFLKGRLVGLRASLVT